MQILIFMGEAYHPKQHLGDFLLTLSEMPSIDDIAGLVRKKMLDPNNGLNTDQVTWVTALCVDGISVPRRFAWDVGYTWDIEALQRKGYTSCWRHGGHWCGVKSSERDSTEMKNPI